MRVTPRLAAIVMSVCTVTAAPLMTASANAADLDGESYAEPPYGDDAYVDDNDGPDYERGAYGSGEPPPGSVKDGYPVPMPPPRYSDRPIPQERVYERVERRRIERTACLPRWEVRRRLNNEGWTDIRPMGGRDGVVRIHARRFDSGRIFQLRVDRCSGDVLTARPHYLRGFAYRERPWRY